MLHDNPLFREKMNERCFDHENICLPFPQSHKEHQGVVRAVHNEWGCEAKWAGGSDAKFNKQEMTSSYWTVLGKQKGPDLLSLRASVLQLLN